VKVLSASGTPWSLSMIMSIYNWTDAPKPTLQYSGLSPCVAIFRCPGRDCLGIHGELKGEGLCDPANVLPIRQRYRSGNAVFMFTSDFQLPLDTTFPEPFSIELPVQGETITAAVCLFDPERPSRVRFNCPGLRYPDELSGTILVTMHNANSQFSQTFQCPLDLTSRSASLDLPLRNFPVSEVLDAQMGWNQSGVLHLSIAIDESGALASNDRISDILSGSDSSDWDADTSEGPVFTFRGVSSSRGVLQSNEVAWSGFRCCLSYRSDQEFLTIVARFSESRDAKGNVTLTVLNHRGFRSPVIHHEADLATTDSISFITPIRTRELDDHSGWVLSDELHIRLTVALAAVTFVLGADPDHVAETAREVLSGIPCWIVCRGGLVFEIHWAQMFDGHIRATLRNFRDPSASVERTFTTHDDYAVFDSVKDATDFLSDGRVHLQVTVHLSIRQWTISISDSFPLIEANALISSSSSDSFFDPIATGFVGLRNQGATCYMNSMLQALFCTPAFRRLVYEMPTTGAEDPSRSIPLCLQRLFCRMQLNDTACSTTALTKSFGWDDYETIVQHDV
jgi:hypothetical protein